MLKKSIILLAFLLCSFLSKAEVRVQVDSTVLNALSAKLQEYFEAIKYEPVQVQMGECDFLIESTSDSLLRSHVVRTIYNHYASSPVMGVEAVAIHVYDRWYKPGLVKMNSDEELFGAKIFAEFNRLSQVGCKAPELTMEAIDGSMVQLFDSKDSQTGFRILYFYDVDCPNCKIQSILLNNLFITETFPVEFYAIYTGDNRESWMTYISDRFDFSTLGSVTKAVHLWDPELDSDFQRKYGVLQTPRMFLIAPNGEIVGRGLDALALAEMLHKIFDSVELEYGSDESAELFDGIFSGVKPVASDVRMLADQIASSTLSKGDTVMFRQMTGDLLYYLSTRSGEGLKEGLSDLISDRILCQPKIWRTADDSLKVVGFAKIMNDLLSKSVPGSCIADLKVPGLFISSRGEKRCNVKLSKLSGQRNVIIFYTEGCEICDAQKAATRHLLKSDYNVNGKLNVLLINVDDILRDNPNLASKLFDSFDLSTLPLLIETDNRGIILRRYFLL